MEWVSLGILRLVSCSSGRSSGEGIDGSGEPTAWKSDYFPRQFPIELRQQWGCGGRGQ